MLISIKLTMTLLWGSRNSNFEPITWIDLRSWVKDTCPNRVQKYCLSSSLLMLTFDESEIFYGFGNFSLITTLFKYSGLNLAWIPSIAPTSTNSESLVKLSIPPVKSTEPTSKGVTYMCPSNLDDDIIINDRPVPSLLTKNGTHNLTKPAKEPTVIITDTETEFEMAINKVGYGIPKVQVDEWDLEYDNNENDDAEWFHSINVEIFGQAEHANCTWFHFRKRHFYIHFIMFANYLHFYVSASLLWYLCSINTYLFYLYLHHLSPPPVLFVSSLCLITFSYKQLSAATAHFPTTKSILPSKTYDMDSSNEVSILLTFTCSSLCSLN